MDTHIYVISLIILSLAILSVAVSLLRSGNPPRAMFMTAAQGIVALFAVNTAGLLTGVTLSVNWYTLGAGAIFGTPGVISLLLLDVIF